MKKIHKIHIQYTRVDGNWRASNNSGTKAERPGKEKYTNKSKNVLRLSFFYVFFFFTHFLLFFSRFFFSFHFYSCLCILYLGSCCYVVAFLYLNCAWNVYDTYTESFRCRTKLIGFMQRINVYDLYVPLPSF